MSVLTRDEFLTVRAALEGDEGLAARMLREKVDLLLAARDAEPSLERRGLDLLLLRHPDAALARYERNDTWLIVDVEPPEGGVLPMAVFRRTGAVYRSGAFGAVEDDPVLVPVGSPYDGPTAT